MKKVTYWIKYGNGHEMQAYFYGELVKVNKRSRVFKTNTGAYITIKNSDLISIEAA